MFELHARKGSFVFVLNVTGWQVIGSISDLYRVTIDEERIIEAVEYAERASDFDEVWQMEVRP